MDEGELVAGLKRHDLAIIEVLVETHGDRLLRSATLLCGDQSYAEDLVQDVFLEAMQSVHRFRGQASLYTWLHSILLNLTRHHRRDNRRLIYDNDLAAEEEAHDLGEEGPHRADLRSAATELKQALKQLSNEHREVLVLRFFERMKIDEMAQHLGISIGTVKSRLHYGIEQMRKTLPPEMNLFGAKGTKETV